MLGALSRLLLACLLVGVAGFTFGGVAQAEARQKQAVDQVFFTAQTPSAPSGPDLPPAPAQQDPAKERQKLVIGVLAIGLLAVVVVGRRMRAKRRKKIAGG